MTEKYGGDPKTETDFRRVLDNRGVDAVTIAAPDHWHALMTIWACQAGKDVYVEKPISHNIVEGRRMIEAARRYNRVVAVGTQRRSSVVLGKAVQFLRDGGLGKVYAGKAVIYRLRDPIGVTADNPVPPGSVLLTGTGLVPPDDFTLEPGHVVEVSVPGIGTLTNPVGAAADLLSTTRRSEIHVQGA